MAVARKNAGAASSSADRVAGRHDRDRVEKLGEAARLGVALDRLRGRVSAPRA
jgi:hypothetical protein